MNSTPILYQSVSKGEFQEPPLSPKPNHPSGYELHLGLIAMVRALPFSVHDDENPCQHLLNFEEMCSCLSISCMTQETLRWKLFPFSLMGRAKQWYTNAVESTNRDWDELKDKFCLAFFPMYHIDSLPRAILDFEQRKKESIGIAWARFLTLLHASLDLSLLDGVILHLFCIGLDIADLCLDMTTRGRFTHKTMMEQVEFMSTS
jgi:hypothetical protein